MSERIQKALATAGVASRREIERLIAEGRITVNGKLAEVGQKVDASDHIRLDNRPVSVPEAAERPRVLLYKKRVGEIVTRDDPEGRRTVFRKLPDLKQGRWIAVGRLDLNTSGLLLFTNHGELARRLTHPSFEIPRVYAVRVLGTVDEAVIRRLTTGVELEDGVGRFVRMEPGDNEDGEGANQWYRVVVREGRNRFVRRMIESQDLQVSRLIRTAYGPLELGRGIKSGSAREAEPEELLALLDAVGMKEESRAAGRRAASRRDAERAPAKRPTERPPARGRAADRGDSRRGEAGSRASEARASGRPASARQRDGDRKLPTSRRPEGRTASSKPSDRGGRPAAGKPAPRRSPAAKAPRR